MQTRSPDTLHPTPYTLHPTPQTRDKQQELWVCRCSNPIQSNPTQPNPTRPNPTQPDPTRPNPTQPDPTSQVGADALIEDALGTDQYLAWFMRGATLFVAYLGAIMAFSGGAQVCE